LYNLIVNLNQYGSDKLTGIFKEMVGKRDTNSLYYQYWKYTGERDISAFMIDPEKL